MECTPLPTELRRANDGVKKLYEYNSRREVIADEPDDLARAIDALALGQVIYVISWTIFTIYLGRADNLRIEKLGYS